MLYVKALRVEALDALGGHVEIDWQLEIGCYSCRQGQCYLKPTRKATIELVARIMPSVAHKQGGLESCLC